MAGNLKVVGLQEGTNNDQNPMVGPVGLLGGGSVVFQEPKHQRRQRSLELEIAHSPKLRGF